MPPHPRPLADRFWAKVNKTDDCWLWTGATSLYNGLPYGRIWVREDRNSRFTHRVAWFLHHGEWPEGVIDHLCKNTMCVRIDHLESVSQRENVLRGNGAGARAVRTGLCKRGHSHWSLRPDGRRMCLTCQSLRRQNRL